MQLNFMYFSHLGLPFSCILNSIIETLINTIESIVVVIVLVIKYYDLRDTEQSCVEPHF